MLCFTSPTIRLLPSSWLIVSESNTLKFCHWMVEVSWNSSIMTCFSWVPIFSKMNGESLPSIKEWSSCWVSLNRKRFSVSLSSRTFLSMLLSRRNWFRCRNVRWADWYIFHCLARSSIAKRSISNSVLSTSWCIISRRGWLLAYHLLGFSRQLATVRFSMVGSNTPLVSFRKKLQIPRLFCAKSSMLSPSASIVSKKLSPIVFIRSSAAWRKSRRQLE